MLFSLA
jgi:hypothetical protein